MTDLSLEPEAQASARLVEPVLPLDLLLTVAEYLLSDRPTLTTYSLVCRALVPFCQKHLFHTITLGPFIDTTMNGHSPIKFLSMIMRNPDIASYVRTLRIRLWTPNDDGGDATPLEITYPIFQRLSNLEALEIYGRFSPSSHWPDLPDRVRASFYFLGQLSSMQKLTLWDVETLPVSFFCAFPNLTHLSLTSVEISDDRPTGDSLPDANKSPHRPSLEFLALHSMGTDVCELFATDRPIFDSNQLHTLIIDDRMMPSSFNSIAIFCGRSVKRLEMHKNVTDYVADSRAILGYNFGPFASLTHLVVHIHVGWSSTIWIFQRLGHLGRVDGLVDVRIRFRPDRLLCDAKDLPLFRQIGSFISRIPSLQGVCFEVVTTFLGDRHAFTPAFRHILDKSISLPRENVHIEIS